MPDKKIVGGVVRKHKLSEGFVPYFTQRGPEEFAVGRAMTKIGGATKKALGAVYPGARKKQKKK